MYSRKSKGPKKEDPYDTPNVILEALDAKPLTDTNCVRSAKYDSNRLFANPRIP